MKSVPVTTGILGSIYLVRFPRLVFVQNAFLLGFFFFFLGGGGGGGGGLGYFRTGLSSEGILCSKMGLACQEPIMGSWTCQ